MAGLSRCCARSDGQNLADSSQPFATDAILYRRSAAIRDIANFKTDVLVAPSHKATSNGLGYAALSSAVAVYIACVLNGGFWSAFRGTVDPASLFEYLFIGATFLILVALCTLLLTLFAIPYVFRPFAILLLLTAAASSYFMNEYGTVFDANMLRNVLETNQSEALELVTWKLAGHLTLFGVLPSAVVWSVPIARRPPAEIVARNVKTGSICALVIASLSFPFLMNFLSVFRENKQLVHSVTPINAIQAVSKYYIKRSKSAGSQVSAIGLDARKSDAWSQRPRKSVLVIVLGETARSDHFSINGYSKPTTPRLSTVPGLISFTNVRSCGTDTADSVPCMFSNLGRANFTPERAAAQEGLLDVIQRARLSVLWRDNQSGCKGVCARVPAESLARSNSVFHCTDGDCYDEILLDGLREKIDQIDGSGVVVLHMMGSHGPAYYKRTPVTFQTFQPVCLFSQFSRCTNAEIVNSYDNTINYADVVLSKLIALLSSMSTAAVDTSMIYVSDHGESLGANNLYLHGIPYAFAPLEQSHVPMLMWFSPTYQNAFGIDTSCLSRKTQMPLSHDNFFHTVLGVLDIETSLYDQDLDVLEGCRS